MAYEERKVLYGEIETLRERPLIAYVTSHRKNADAKMASDIIPELTRQIEAIPPEFDSVDLLVVSNGGDPTVAWRVTSMLRERFERVGALLPYAAYSAATLLALGADEILMHPFSNMGPVDPQLSYVRRVPGRQDQIDTIQFGSEDLSHFLDFIKKEVGISDQEQLEKAFELVCQDVGAIPIGVARRSSHLALSMGEKLLKMHMNDENKASAIAEALNKSFYHHGYPLGRTEAREIGLPVHDPPQELEELLWRVWIDMESEMECNHPFDPVELLMNDPKSAALFDAVPHVQIPANLPPQVAQQAYQQILQQIQIQGVPPVDYQLFSAALESVRSRSHYYIRGKVFGVRRPDLSLGLNVVRLTPGWEYKHTLEGVGAAVIGQATSGEGIKGNGG